MSPLKFSSAASRSIEGVFLPAPGYQSFPYARRRKPSLDFPSNGCGLFLTPVKVGGDFGLVPQVVRDHGVHVRQGNGGVLLRDLLGGRTGVERRDKGVERHPRTGDTHDAVGVSVNWNPLNRFGQVHWKLCPGGHAGGSENRRSSNVGRPLMFPIVRPPVAQERLHLTGEGQVRLELRQPWCDGTTDVVFDPVEFLGRLAVLVPRPRINLILYHGVLGPRAAWRSEVVRRRQTSRADRDAGLTESATEPAREVDPAETVRRQARGQTWASLMARTFGFDVLACPRCGGRLRLIALIEEAVVIGRILRHLGLPTEIPAPSPARAPPLPAGVPDAAGWDDDASVFNPCS
jgi:Putative transposase